MNFAAGLSAVYPGMMQGDTAIADLDLKQAQAKNAMTQLAALAARGNGLQALMGGPQGGGPGGAMAMPPGMSSGPPPQGPQGPPPQGPGMPQQPPMQQPQAGPPQRPGMQPQGPGMPPQGMVGQGGMAGGGQLDWRTVIRSLQQTNPGAPPEVLAAAVDQFLPMMNMQSRQEWQALSLQLREQQLQQQQTMQEQRLEHQDNRDDKKYEFQERRGTPRTSMGSGSPPQGASPDQPRTFDGERPQPAQYRFDDQGQPIPTLRPPAARGGTGRAETLKTQLQRQAIDELTEELGHRPSALEIGRRENEIKAAGKARSKTQIEQENAQNQYKQIDTTISDAISSIQKGYAKGLSVTGLMGTGQRIGEIAQNMAGIDPTLASEFAQQIRILRAQVPKLLAGRSQISKDERASIEKIIPGLEAGSTQQITFQDLKYLQKIMRMRAPSGTAYDPEPGAAPAPKAGASPQSGALKPMTPEVEVLRSKALDQGHSAAEVEKYLRDLGYDPAARAPQPQGDG